MTQHDNDTAWPDHKPTALLVLADGTVLEGFGLGAEGHAVGEVCFNTAMTGYEEILTDPSYAGQLITFTFPHIGNVGTNEEDIETVNMAATPGARGVILRTAITDPSNYRATKHLDAWLKARGIIGLAIDQKKTVQRQVLEIVVGPVGFEGVERCVRKNGEGNCFSRAFSKVCCKPSGESTLTATMETPAAVKSCVSGAKTLSCSMQRAQPLPR